jgi:tRNA (guanine37-N1)-methyltransferase
MVIDVITLFPGMFTGVLSESIIGRARVAGVVDVRVHDLREYADGRHRVTDDYPFGGGAGMVMKPEPIYAAVEALVGRTVPWEDGAPGARVILLCPQGRRFDQAIAGELAAEQRLIFICGHYEGVDERVRGGLATDELSLGDFVLTGGEPAAIAVIDAVVRLLPGALGQPQSTEEESHRGGILEYPQYTRPREFRGQVVPEVLISGHHENVRRWRREESLRRTFARRPDLLASASLTEADRRFLESLGWREET